MVEIRWSEKASRHLQAIYKYIGTYSKIYAKRYIKLLIESTYKLEKMPKCGRKVPEFEDSDFREIIFKNHRIIYRIAADNCIDILAIIHGAQDLKTKFDKEE